MAQSLALSLLVLVLAFCIPWTQGSDGGAQDCCLRYSQRKIPLKAVRSYRKQEPSLGCAIPAVVFSPRKRSQPELCADPKEAWVQQLMQRLDKPPARQKPVQDCKKDKGGSKSGKKGKGTKGCKSPSHPSSALPGLRLRKDHSPVPSLEPRSPHHLTRALSPNPRGKKRAGRKEGLGHRTASWCRPPSPLLLHHPPLLYSLPYPAWLSGPHRARPREAEEGESPRKCERRQQDCPLRGKVTQDTGPDPAPHCNPPLPYKCNLY
uniref:Chemokine interleukin-8-like domain-containing protein n=1 Tax=Equus caballus TaxID=9796 RepID=F7A287_HORSE